MTILALGANGQVGHELARIDGVTALSRAAIDLTALKGAAGKVAAYKPKAIINAAAYTAVDKAESEQDLAWAINADAPPALARIAHDLGIPFIHISTDYVFSGGGETAFIPTDQTGPIGAYGASKRAGEIGVAAIGGRYAILRTSWVFSSHGQNFVKTMLRLSESRDALTVVHDQIGGPTSARSIACACHAMALALQSDPSKAGIYHFSGQPDASWADFARQIFQQADRQVTVSNITTDQFPTPAARPSNSRMDCRSLQDSFGIDRPDWRADLADVLRELQEQDQ